MDTLLIVGSGGHARSVMDMVLQNGTYRIIGCVDKLFPQQLKVTSMSSIPIIGTDEDLEKIHSEGVENIFIAVGDNKLRRRLSAYAINLGYKLVNVISRHAVISSSAQLGVGICVMPGAVINVNTCIGDLSIINTNCSIDHDCVIGQCVHIAPGVTLSGSVTVGDLTHIGTGSSVIDGISIGAKSYIGAGSVVVKNIDSETLAYGVPAKGIRKY